MTDLTVFCVCVGDKYPSAYVYALRDAVAEYLTVPHTFKCITTRSLPGIKTVLPFVPYSGWWSKINLFSPTIARGPSVYLDLDTIPVKNIDYLVKYTQYQFAAPANWAQSGFGGIQSSVMAWRGGFYLPYNEIRKKWPGQVDEEGYRILGGKKFWGDQEFLFDLLGDDWVRIPGIGSFKYHCRAGIPSDLSIVCFHGEPKQIEVTDPWILPHTQVLRDYLKRSSVEPTDG